MRSHSITLWSWCAAMTFAVSTAGLAASNKSSLPDEITTTGGEGSAQAGGGAALISDQAAIHINPAMLYLHRNYDVAGSYIWPVAGRPFYRLAAVDGTTSKSTFAFEYTGFADSLEKRETRDNDSPVRRRGSLAFAIPTQTFSIGFAGHYVEADDLTKDDASTVKGFTLGAGIAAQLSESIRFGASIENFNNKKVNFVAPQTIRAGLAYQDSALGLYADYRDRERSAYLEGIPLLEDGTLAAVNPATIDDSQPHEKMAIIGGQIKTFDVLKLFAAAGRNVSGEKSQTVSGGLGIYQKNFSIAYAVSRTYPDTKDLQNSLHLSVTMKM